MMALLSDSNCKPRHHLSAFESFVSLFLVISVEESKDGFHIKPDVKTSR